MRTTNTSSAVVFACIPDRIFRDNQLRANRYFDELLGRVGDDGTHFDPDRATSSGPENVSGFVRYYYFLNGMLCSGFEGIEIKFLFTQTTLDQGRIAIDIERLRIARGAIPETLAELVPDFIPELPRDVYSGAPTAYRPKGNGRYLLYSVGPDRRDDGGAIDLKKSEIRQPDWVWPHSRD